MTFKKSVCFILLTAIIIGTVLLTSCGDKVKIPSGKILLANEMTSATGLSQSDSLAPFQESEAKNDPSASRSLTEIIGGEEVHLSYIESVHVPYSDRYIHVYSADTLKDAKVFVDADKKKVVGFASMPLDPSGLQTEQDYLDVIRRYASFDEKAYSYSVETGFRFDDGAYHAHKTEPGFGIPEYAVGKTQGDREYSFYFDRYYRGINVNDYIYASFRYRGDELFLILRAYTQDFDFKSFDSLIDKLDLLEAKMASELRTRVTDGYEMRSYTVQNVSIFVKDKRPYIHWYVLVDYCRLDDGTVFQSVVTAVADETCLTQ